jgi:hypothetical protein
MCLLPIKYLNIKCINKCVFTVFPAQEFFQQTSENELLQGKTSYTRNAKN